MCSAPLSLSTPKRLLTKIAMLPKVNKLNYVLCGSQNMKVNITQVDENCSVFLPRGTNPEI